MANTFSFVGKISRRKENAFTEKKFDSGWVINELNLIMTCGDNVQFLYASGGMWDEKHASKNSVMTMKYNENSADEKVTIKWEDRLDPDVVASVANYKTFTVDTEIAKVREEIKASGDQAAIDASNKKHKIFITAIDFVRWLDKVTSNEKTKDWVWKVTGEVEYSFSKGKYYRNFVPKRVYHVDPATEPQCVGTIKTFFSEGCVDDGDEDNILFNVYTQYYDQMCKKNCFTPMPLVIAKNHPKANGFAMLYNKAEGDEVRELGVNVAYINGSQKVAITEDMLTDEQRELLDMNMITMDDIRKEIGDTVYGDKKTETRIEGIARGYTSGSKDTAFVADDLTRVPSKDDPAEEVESTVDVFNEEEDDI